MTNNETEVTQALAPCPKCRSTNVCPDQFNAVTRNRWTVGCEDCDWMTATHETEAEAVQDWNRLAGIEEGKRLGGEGGFDWADDLSWHKPVHRAVMASVGLGSWMSAALDDPAVCDAMKADIREWFSAGEPMQMLAEALTLTQPTSSGLERVAEVIYIETSLNGSKRGNKDHLAAVFGPNARSDYKRYGANARRAARAAIACIRLAQPTPSSDEVDHLRAALEEIINPIIAMHDRAKAENCQLDGMTANILARDPEYLRQVAREALSALPTTSSTRMMVMKANRELLEAAKELRDDLLMRGERDADGTIIVNASFGRWKRFVEAIARATETPDDRG